ncbi:type II secretion system F family protein [Allosalinactinospora lopnorensis]|uniref:type II secretion system F family protein n=1 Tax=Allosalinactinospora lopnorensis TaxID=1352348 RepID=UPI001F32E696|nr:type II secretion system F family protein [Allosalinactinospora lopnorensis]
MEEWVRQLASRLSAGIVVEQALVASAQTAPTAVRAEVARLSARLRNGWPSSEALRRFADELASPVGDLVVAELSLAATRQGAGVSQSLSQLADLVAEEVAMHRQIEAERARPRLTARLVTIIAVIAAGFLALSGEYMQPYASATGQIALAGIGMVFIAAMIWMRRMTATRPGPRFLQPAESSGGDQR